MFAMVRCLFVACAFLTCLTLSAEEEGVFEPFTGEVQGSRVRLRLQPDVESYIVREVNQNDLLVVVGEAHDYYAIQPLKDQKAYVYRTYVLDGEVTGSHVNVRLAPDVEAPIIGQLNVGDKVNGIVCEENPRWLEISPPDGACFFVSKEYLRHVGNKDLIATRSKRESEVRHLLNSAYLTSQAELRKPFEQIDFARVESGFRRVLQDYSEFPQFTEKADKILAMAKDVYLQKKVAYLEAKAIDPAMPWDGSQSVLNDALVQYQKRLESFEKELQEEGLAVLAESAAHPQTVTLELEPQELATKGMEVEFTPVERKIKDRMLVWQPVEEALYHLWAMAHGDCSMREFYEEQELEAEYLEGIVEAYDRPIPNRPGDYRLVVNGRPAAFLYSTKVDLSDLVGEKVMVKAVARPNHHFAFPAYFVVDVG
ncbi:MAG: hypothetical protein JSR80_08010 [Verrucomicrobia bacterium]|nr:hypothetical protein [Verrucomicrobiota bacterium]